MVGHPVVVRNGGVPGAGLGPTILRRTDEDFIAAILDELMDTDLEKVAETVAKLPSDGTANGDPGVLKLYQPVHRTFHVALIDVACDTFGLPRLDPRKIVEAGLVLRRYGMDEAGKPIYDQLEGWRTQLRGSMTPRRILRGWVPFDNDTEEIQEPDPQQRPLQLLTGHPEVNRQLAALTVSPGPLSENTAPLFVAPPEVCEARERTILYGLVPVTSSEVSESPDTSTLAPDFVQSRLASYLRAATGPRVIPRAGQTLTHKDMDFDPEHLPDDYTLVQDYLSFLRQLQYEFDAFGDSDESTALLAVLNEIQLWYGRLELPVGIDGINLSEDIYIPAGDALKMQADTLVNQTPNTSVVMPSGSPNQSQAWPPISEDLAARIADAAKASLDARLARVRSREPRFHTPVRQYCIRAFVRVAQDDDCPPKIFWSEYSRPFTIAPWYDNSDVPPVQILLPDLDGNSLKKLKPNVAFVVPPSLQNLLQGIKLKGLIDGNKPGGSGVTIDWICAFSIPIITICAFIVLNIFLQLLDIVFFWMAFIKICIPIPKKITTTPR